MVDRPNRFYSKRQEDRVAGLLGAKRIANSGARFEKGDVSGAHLLIECKTLTKPQKSHSIQKEWIEQNEMDAFGRGKQIAALAFDFGDGGNNYIVVRDDTFRMLYDAWLEINKPSEEEN